MAATSTEKDPIFPFTVIFADGERLTLDNVNDAECNLEWFDTEDEDDDPVVVLDRLGRPVSLKIEALRMVRCELKSSSGQQNRP